MPVQIGATIGAMVQFDENDRGLINHFLKVYGYAKAIGELEKLDAQTLEILEVAAVVHDIGIPPSIERYGSAAGPHQEALGPIHARPMLAELGYDAALIERVCYLIAHHHSYDTIDGIDYQILIEADFLVNLDEGNASRETILSAQKLFRTETGRALLDGMFLQK